MKTLFLSFVLFLCAGLLNAQDSIRKFELGSTLITLNSANSGSFDMASRAQFEFFNGVFFRTTKKRLGLRFNMGYNESNLKTDNDPNCYDCMYGNAAHKNFTIGVGGQLNLLRKRDYMYSYLDLNYRNVFTSGYMGGGFGGYNDNFSKTTDGIETNLGVAFKLRFFKSIYLSAEPGYSIYYASVKEKRTSLTFNTTLMSNSFFVNANPFFKLHLTAKF